MLDNGIIKKIEDFVYSTPRSIQEIAIHLGKNWRTADRYVQEIEKSFGSISTKVFREGTRGALKIVFWASVEKVSSSVFQEKLEQEIIQGRKKEDFSAFDIYQHISSKDKKVSIEKQESEETTDLNQIKELLESAEKQMIIFTGNLSWINLKNKSIDIFSVIDRLVKKGVSLKVVSRVDLASLANIEKLLSLNFKYGKQLVEIRHREQPIRAFIVDGRFLRMKEIKEPTGRIHELNKKVFIFYTLKDKEWISWLAKIFWKMFSQSIIAEKRIEELKRLKT